MLKYSLLLIIAVIAFPDSPEDSTSYEILAPGSFHGSEASSRVNGEIWSGVFETGSGYELRLAEMIVEDAIDPYLDRGEERTARLIYAADAVIDPYYDWEYQTDRWSSDDADRLMFFLRPADSVFFKGPLYPVMVDSPDIPPDTTIELGDSGLSLVATNEGLYLFDGSTSQRLSDVYPNSHGEAVSVVWVGDLDGDGKLDLVLDDQPHYAYWVFFRLFLSSEAEPGELVKEVAVFEAAGC
ncbi:MAG: VCBS repeat-containing protein [Candidatus Aegiribacteria sp.]|nr:VCBS repeat-containing protein [Candidatus Aegiribacteria sp.]